MRWSRMAAALLVVVAGCSTGGTGSTVEPSAALPSSGPSLATAAASSSRTSTGATTALDSIAVFGHSGATGTLTDPQSLQKEANENSWATGENPKIQSIYTRLLETHPAMEGHNYNAAVGGSRVDNLSSQVDQVLRIAKILPDLVLVQTIDNDMRCDGTDEANYEPFAATLEQVLSKIEQTMPGARVFFVSQWASVAVWTKWAQHVPEQVADNTGTGPCDLFAPRGRPRPAGIASMQAIVDGYWAQVVRVCSQHPSCSIDGGIQQRQFVPVDADVSPDHNHLSAQGHTKATPSTPPSPGRQSPRRSSSRPDPLPMTVRLFA